MLERIHKQSKYYQVRQRAHCIQLSYQGYKISELMEIFKVSRNTIYNWEKGLEIFFLPTYSPQLNIIEIFWRFIKYKWLETEDYESYFTLVEAVENILINFGTKYPINFA